VYTHYSCVYFPFTQFGEHATGGTFENPAAPVKIGVFRKFKNVIAPIGSTD
jgi:hypothetical protein